MTKEVYYRSVDKLLDAYNNDELRHGNCYKCAVGNLLGSSVWTNDFCTSAGIQQLQGRFEFRTLSLEMDQIIKPSDAAQYTKEEKDRARQYLDNLYEESGITIKELKEIEWEFENSLARTEKGYSYYAHPVGEEGVRPEDVPSIMKEGQFIGLTAVLKVMEGMVGEEVTSGQERLQEIYDKKVALCGY